MSTSTESSGGNIFTGFGGTLGENPKPGFWGRVNNWWDRLFGRNRNKVDVGPAEEISEKQFSNKISTWQIVSTLLFNSTDPYSAIGNMGVGDTSCAKSPYFEPVIKVTPIQYTPKSGDFEEQIFTMPNNVQVIYNKIMNSKK